MNKSINYYKLSHSAELAFTSAIYIGWSLQEETNYREAIKYYNSFKNNIKDSLQKGVLWQEISSAYYSLQQNDSAKFYLVEVLDYPYIQTNKAKRYSMMADLYFDNQQIDSAIFFAKKTLLFKTGITTRRNIYRILANSYSLNGDTHKTKEYMSKYQDCTDSIRKIDSQIKGSYIETMHNTQKEVVKSRSWMWYLSVLFFLITSAGIYLYINKHKKSKLTIEQNKLIHSKEKAEIRKEFIFKKRETIMTNIDRIKQEQKKPENKSLNFEQRIKNMYNELLHIQDITLFFCEMDSALNNIVSKLREVLPEISEKELTYCCLQLLKTPTHDILILLDYESVNSLKGMKRRLAQKLNLQNASLLNDYLLNLLSID